MSEDAHTIEPYEPFKKRGVCLCCEIPKNGQFLNCGCSLHLCWRCQRCDLCCAWTNGCLNSESHAAYLTKAEIRNGSVPSAATSKASDLTDSDKYFLKELLVRW